MQADHQPTQTQSNSQLVCDPLNPFYPDEPQQGDQPGKKQRVNWNPFAPTTRDIRRTEQLAQKKLWITILLALLFPIGNLFYLKRGENAAKLFCYTVSFGLIIALTGGDAVDARALGRTTNNINGLLMGLEQIVCVVQAKQRKQPKAEQKAE